MDDLKPEAEDLNFTNRIDLKPLQQHVEQIKKEMRLLEEILLMGIIQVKFLYIIRSLSQVDLYIL